MTSVKWDQCYQFLHCIYWFLKLITVLLLFHIVRIPFFQKIFKVCSMTMEYLPMEYLPQLLLVHHHLLLWLILFHSLSLLTFPHFS